MNKVYGKSDLQEILDLYANQDSRDGAIARAEQLLKDFANEDVDIEQSALEEFQKIIETFGITTNDAGEQVFTELGAQAAARFQTMIDSVGNAENATGTSNATEGTLQPQPVIDPSLYEDKTVVVSQLKEIVVDGNTMLYLLTEDGEFYHAKYTDVLEMMTVQPKDTVEIKVYEDMFLLK